MKKSSMAKSVMDAYHSERTFGALREFSSSIKGREITISKDSFNSQVKLNGKQTALENMDGFFDFIFGKKKTIVSIAQMVVSSVYGNKNIIGSYGEAEKLMQGLKKVAEAEITNLDVWGKEYFSMQKGLKSAWDKSSLLVIDESKHYDRDFARKVKNDFNVISDPVGMARWSLEHTGSQALFDAVRKALDLTFSKEYRDEALELMALEKNLLEQSEFKKAMNEIRLFLESGNDKVGVDWCFQLLERLYNQPLMMFFENNLNKQADVVYGYALSAKWFSLMLSEQEVFYKKANIARALNACDPMRLGSLINGLIKVIQEALQGSSKPEDAIEIINASGESKDIMDWLTQTDRYIKDALNTYRTEVGKFKDEPIKAMDLFATKNAIETRVDYLKDHSALYDTLVALSRLDFILDTKGVSEFSGIEKVLQGSECLQALPAFYGALFELVQFSRAYNADTHKMIQSIGVYSLFACMDLFQMFSPAIAFGARGADNLNRNQSSLMEMFSKV